MEINIEKIEEPFKDYKIMHCQWLCVENIPYVPHKRDWKFLGGMGGGDIKVAYWRASIVVGQEKHR